MNLITKLNVTLTIFCISIIATGFNFTSDNLPVIVPQSKQTKEASSTTTCFPGLSFKITPNNSSPSSYFPRPVISEEMIDAKWYSKHLKAMKEQSLPYEVEGDGYRFLWLPAFEHPYAMRIWHSKKGYWLNVKKLSGEGGFEPGKLVMNQTCSITESEWREFITLLEKACYWQIPSKDQIGVQDGAHWILEGMKDGRYHIVDRNSPEDGGYYEACIFLVKLSGIIGTGEF